MSVYASREYLPFSSPSLFVTNLTWCLGGTESQPLQQHQGMAAQDEKDPRLARISSSIRVIPDFPKKGFLLSLVGFEASLGFVDLALSRGFFLDGRDFVSGYNDVASRY